jgi:O-antigen/teichoic acid export membrane protein
MGVSLYTSRVVLATLGVEDYGIYNVVGGVVVLFSFINSAMASATQRFLSFELGRNDINEVKRIFSMSMTVHFCIAMLIIVLGETFGLWFLNTQMNIPECRMMAANWVYQISIITTCIGIIQTPYNASIIAYEKMSFYAYVGIVEVVLKLLLVFLLVHIAFDKLKLFSLMVFAVCIMVFGAYKVYCNKTLTTSRYNFFWDKPLFLKLINFSGWSLFGGVANVGKSQGINILINIFYGVTVNAAVAISNQVMGAIHGFTSNFQTAFNPQIVKLYAQDNRNALLNMIYRTSRYSFFLLFVISLPVLLNTDIILQIWLKTIPEYSGIFTQLNIVYMLVNCISSPMWMTAAATGDIKKYQIIISAILLLNVLFSYILLKFHIAPYSVLIVSVAIEFIGMFYRIWFLREKIQMPSIDFFKKVLLKLSFVVIISVLLAYYIKTLLPDNLLGAFVSIISTVVIIAISIYAVGIESRERYLVIKFVKNKMKKNAQTLY